MGIVVIHGDPGDLALELEPAADSGVGGEPVGQRLRVDAEFDAGGQGGHRIEQHVRARHGQRQADPAPVGQPDSRRSGLAARAVRCRGPSTSRTVADALRP